MLREGVGARAAAMGEAYTAVAGDQTAAHWNPAGVAALRGKDFVLSHHRSFQGIQQGYGGWAYGNGTRGVALSAGVHGSGGLEYRTGPTAAPLGTFSVFEAAAGVTVAQRLGGGIYVGTSLRGLHEDIASARASGVAVDLGVLYRSRLEGLWMGAAYRNLGRTERLASERIPLPRTFRVGASLVRGAVAGSADYRMPERGDRGLNLGLEYALQERLFLRGGYRTGSKVRGLSAGLGAVHRNWRIDYAYVPSRQGLGASHRVAVGIR